MGERLLEEKTSQLVHSNENCLNSLELMETLRAKMMILTLQKNRGQKGSLKV